MCELGFKQTFFEDVECGLQVFLKATNRNTGFIESGSNGNATTQFVEHDTQFLVGVAFGIFFHHGTEQVGNTYFVELVLFGHTSPGHRDGQIHYRQFVAVGHKHAHTIVFKRFDGRHFDSGVRTGRRNDTPIEIVFGFGVFQSVVTIIGGFVPIGSHRVIVVGGFHIFSAFGKHTQNNHRLVFDVLIVHTQNILFAERF